MFDLTRVTLLVAELDSADGNDAPRLISVAGSVYKWMDSTHILVVLRASGGAAVRKAGDLAAQVNGVDSWISFEDWRQQQVMEVQRVRDRKNCKNGHLDEAAST